MEDESHFFLPFFFPFFFFFFFFFFLRFFASFLKSSITSLLASTPNSIRSRGLPSFMIVTNFDAAELNGVITVVVEAITVKVDVHECHVLREHLANLLDYGDLLGFTELIVGEVEFAQSFVCFEGSE